VLVGVDIVNIKAACQPVMQACGWTARLHNRCTTSALVFATTHEQPFPLPALQIVASAAQTDGLSRGENLQYGSVRFVAVLSWDFLDNSVCCLNQWSDTSNTTCSTLTRKGTWPFVNGCGMQGHDF